VKGIELKLQFQSQIQKNLGISYSPRKGMSCYILITNGLGVTIKRVNNVLTSHQQTTRKSRGSKAANKSFENLGTCTYLGKIIRN